MTFKLRPKQWEAGYLEIIFKGILGRGKARTESSCGKRAWHGVETQHGVTGEAWTRRKVEWYQVYFLLIPI